MKLSKNEGIERNQKGSIRASILMGALYSVKMRTPEHLRRLCSGQNLTITSSTCNLSLRITKHMESVVSREKIKSFEMLQKDIKKSKKRSGKWKRESRKKRGFKVSSYLKFVHQRTIIRYRNQRLI